MLHELSSSGQWTIFHTISVTLWWPIMCQFELMDPRETRIWKADYARVRISQEQLKFAGTLHPSPDITKALNNRESRKVPKESRMYQGFNTSKAVSHVSRLHPYRCHLGAHHPLLITYFLSCELTRFFNLDFKIFSIK